MDDRGSAAQRGYTKRWAKVSAAYKLDNPLCLGCQAVGRVTATEVTDHVVPHRGKGVLFWDPGNWQPSCAWHHNVVKQRLELLFAEGALQARDLKLDSPAAVDLTRRLRRGQESLGADGWLG